jgi:hypothetical protein
LNLFSWLLIGHLVGDFLLQTNWMAVNKPTKLSALLTHVTIYTLVVTAFAYLAGGISYKAAVFIFLTHMILDKRNFVAFWVKNVNKAEKTPWLNIASDQSWHLLILALATLF